MAPDRGLPGPHPPPPRRPTAQPLSGQQSTRNSRAQPKQPIGYGLRVLWLPRTTAHAVMPVWLRDSRRLDPARRAADSVDAQPAPIKAKPAAWPESFNGLFRRAGPPWPRLAGTIAVLVMTGGWAGHSLAVEVHLRPVLVELGATVPARGLYVTEPELGELDAAVAKWAATAAPLITRALKH